MNTDRAPSGPSSTSGPSCASGPSSASGPLSASPFSASAAFLMTHAASIIDISTPLHAHTLTYPGDPVFARTLHCDIDEDGAGYTLSMLSMSAHCGTHLDAPRHFLREGRCIHDIPSTRWITLALVIDTGDAAMIDETMLEGVELREGMSVLFRTKNGPFLARNRMIEHPVGLTTGAAEVLVAARVNLVGIDWLSIEPGDDPSFPVHHLLLGAGILVLETIQLHHIEPGAYTLAVFPLHLIDADGAPARAVLLAAQ